MCRSDALRAAWALLTAGLCVACHGAGDGGGTTDGGADARPSPARVDGGTDPPASTGTVPSSVCLPPLARCGAGAGGECCEGSVCVERDGASRCVQTCKSRFDCGSLCCAVDKTLGIQLCAAADVCPPLPCSDVGGSCTQPGPACCEGLRCVSSASSAFAGCRKPCTIAADCDTHCCVAYANGELGFCAEASACACRAADESCGGVEHCCAGQVCTTFDGTGAFACKPRCTANGDCASGCCRPVGDTGESACLPSTWCK